MENRLVSSIRATALACTFWTGSLFAAMNEISPNTIEGVSINSNSDGSAGENFVVNEGGRNVLSTNDVGTTIQLGQSGTATTAAGSLTVNQGSTLNGSATINGGATVNGLFTATGGATITGTTSINASGVLATTLGGNGNVTSLNSSTINVGTGAYTTAVAIGSAQAGTTVSAQGGNSLLSVADGAASLRSGAGPAASGFATTAAPQTLSTNAVTLATQLNNVGDAASRQNIAGISYVNRLEGNTLINGNTYINGTLVYSSNSAATTTVTSGPSILPGATQATTGQSSIVNAGGVGTNVDSNGRMSVGVVNQTTASMIVTNGYGNTHGFVVNETSATMSGGIRSTSLTLDDNGATFRNTFNGGPARVTGVADGASDFDAVNYRQLRQVAAGVSGTSAMANIPQVDQNKKFAVGAGLGSFQGMTALALGASYRFAPSAVVKASLASSSGANNKNTVYGIGAGFSW
jgi:hypothetical protein